VQLQASAENWDGGRKSTSPSAPLESPWKFTALRQTALQWLARLSRESLELTICRDLGTLFVAMMKHNIWQETATNCPIFIKKRPNPCRRIHNWKDCGLQAKRASSS
jgi:hypothetical protein